MNTRKWLIILATFILCIGIGTTQTFAAVSSINNNFTMIVPDGSLAGGTNDVVFTWNETKKTSVVASGQVSNATLSSVTPFYGIMWSAHDVAIYGPGTYTIYDGCPAKGPGCGVGNPVTFTVGTGQLGAHMLFDWGGNIDIDVVDVWAPNAVFGPSPMFTGPDGTTPPYGNPATVWSYMSSDWDANGFNGYGMTETPFQNFNANFNVNVVGTANNNFTMHDPTGAITGGANDIRFTWNGTKKTSVAVSGQVSNATISAVTPLFYGVAWAAHDVAIYGPGTYTVNPCCLAGSPGCANTCVGSDGVTPVLPITFTVAPGRLGGHMLFDWGGSYDIDVVDIWVPNAVFGPSPIFTGPDGGTVSPSKIWDWMSSDRDGDGINGYSMVDGLFAGFNANFNLMGVPPIGCVPENCDDGNACTLDTCVGSVCVHTAINCDDGNICTTDTCNTATGCVHTATVPASCNDNNACTTDGCANNACTHVTITCNDSNVCTTNTCNPATGCVFTPIVCNDSNVCTTDTCNPATGCVYTPIVCNDNDACTADTCNPATGCVFTPIICNGNNICTIDTCNTATGCVYTPTVPASCNDNNACTTDGCTNNACTHSTITCNDNNACTTDICNTATGCVFTPNNAACAPVANNNFTMLDPANNLIGGTNDVVLAWDGARKTSVAASGQVSNALLSSTCAFYGVTWAAHDVTVYGPGVYTIYTDCAAGSPGCGSGAPITFTVNTGEVGIHALFDWNGFVDIDVANVMKPNVISSNMWTGACGSNAANTIWTWTSYDPNGDGINGIPMVDGPFLGMSANFNLIIITDPCFDAATRCNDNNACTTDSCNTATGACVNTAMNCSDNNACTTDSCNTATGACENTPVVCNDNNACTTDTCNTATGCVFTPISCNDNNACTMDACDTATGCVNYPMPCNDNNACTTDTCNTATGCVFTPLVCNDNNACTTDTCNTATGCVFTAKNCNDNNACTADSCNTATGACVNTAKNCDDNNACTTDSCNTATGACVNTPVVCNDNSLCTTDTCAPATGCVYTPIVCNDNNACTTDICVATTGCVFTSKVCNDNNVCTTNSCNTSTGACVYNPVANGTGCTQGTITGTCQSGTCSSSTCPTGSYRSVDLKGTGSSTSSIEDQIKTEFTVSGSGCILRYTASTITVTPGTVLKVDWKEGKEPNPTSVTWKGVSVPAKTVPYQITCPSTTGTVGNLVLNNLSARGGKDTDTLTISVATN